jgi:hypothetical protein
VIEFVKAYKSSDGTICGSLEEVQRRELALILTRPGTMEGSPLAVCMEELTSQIIDKAAQVIDVLTTKESSLPKARAVNGGKKPRKKRVEALQTTIPGTGLPPEILDESRREAVA